MKQRLLNLEEINLEEMSECSDLSDPFLCRRNIEEKDCPL